MKLQFKSTVLAIAFMAFASVQSFAVKPSELGSFHQFGMGSRHEYTEGFLELAKRQSDYERLVKEGKGPEAEKVLRSLGELSPKQRDLLKNFNEHDLGLLAEYAKASEKSDPAGRREAFEKLHDRFWKVMDSEQVRSKMKLGHLQTPNEMAKEFNGLLSGYKPAAEREQDVRMAERFKAAVAHMEGVEKTHQIRTELLDSAYTTAVSTGSPHLLGDTMNMLRTVGNEPSTIHGVQKMLQMMHAAAEGSLPGLGNRKATGPELAEMRNVVDFVLANGGGPKETYDIANVVSNIMQNKADGTDALHGMNALFAGPAKAVRDHSLSIAEKYGVMKDLREEAKARADEAGIKLKNEKEETDAISLRSIQEALSRKADELQKQGKTAEAAAIREEIAKLKTQNDEVASKALLESMMKINAEAEKAGEKKGSKWEVIKDLFNAMRGVFCCVPKGALLMAGSAAFLLSLDSKVSAAEKPQAQAVFCSAIAGGPGTQKFTEGDRHYVKVDARAHLEEEAKQLEKAGKGPDAQKVRSMGAVCDNVKIDDLKEADNAAAHQLGKVGPQAPDQGVEGANQTGLKAPVAPSGFNPNKASRPVGQ